MSPEGTSLYEKGDTNDPSLGLGLGLPQTLLLEPP